MTLSPFSCILIVTKGNIMYKATLAIKPMNKGQMVTTYKNGRIVRYSRAHCHWPRADPGHPVGSLFPMKFPHKMPEPCLLWPLLILPPSPNLPGTTPYLKEKRGCRLSWEKGADRTFLYRKPNESLNPDHAALPLLCKGRLCDPRNPLLCQQSLQL